MAAKYVTLSLEDAYKLGCEDACFLERLETDRRYDDWHCGVFRCDLNGKPIQLIGSDGGEPEDQTLGRDWRWVTRALNDAYELGQKEHNPV